jgi:hypothetical protein
MLHRAACTAKNVGLGQSTNLTTALQLKQPRFILYSINPNIITFEINNTISA